MKMRIVYMGDYSIGLQYVFQNIYSQLYAYKKTSKDIMIQNSQIKSGRYRISKGGSLRYSLNDED